MKEKKKKFYNCLLDFNMDWIPALMLFVAVGVLIVNVCVFRENVKINENLNRPYIEIDTSRIKELDISRVNPEEVMERYEKNLPIPYVNYLDFSIKNVGKLPARYSIDVSGFKEVGLIELIPQVNDNGFIFPDQTIPITYYLKGETHGENYEEELRQETERQQSLLAGDNTDASRIKVIYEYLGDVERDVDFETVVEERMIEKGGDLPSERMGVIITGYSREWFVVNAK